MNVSDSPIRLAVVDDSSFVRKALGRVLEGDPRFEIAGTAASGEELLRFLEEWNPDAITLDLSMPGIGGLATLDAVLRRRRVPVIILSAHTSDQGPLTMEALHRGAVDFIDKQQFSLVDFEALRSALTEKLLNVVPGRRTEPPLQKRSAIPVAVQPVATGAFDMLLIGASTGGPPAIETLLQMVGPLRVPVAVVQHMPVGFTAAFADRLNVHLPVRVREAMHGASFAAGVAHIARAGMHLKLQRAGDGIVTVLSRLPSSAPHCPSVDVLFESAVPFAKRAIALLLTGMGEDGAAGLSKLCANGAYTIVQDEASSIVYGMPRAAVELHAAREQLPLERMASRIRELLGSGGLASVAPSLPP